jgi:hypothetical protein
MRRGPELAGSALIKLSGVNWPFRKKRFTFSDSKPKNMKKILAIFCASAFVLYACNNEKTADTTNTSTDTSTANANKPDPCAGYVKDTSSAKPPMDSTMMAMWMAYATPGEMHQMLAKDDGEWEGQVTQWMDPAAPPSVSKSTATTKMIMGGRYQQSMHSGCFDGMPFEGMSLVGYDNAKKVFMSSWIDNMGTSFMNLEGKLDSATRTIRFAGQCTNPMDGSQMNIREDFTYVDDNTQKMTMYGPDMTGKEYKMMEIVFTRKNK